MCGIVGAVAKRNVVPVMLEGLKRLEYRGYDSCGIALCTEGHLERSRSTSRVAELEKQVNGRHLSGFLGIAHTRWATHGAPTTDNAHPHFSGERIALVHNGIIENHAVLRAELEAKGYVFSSQTDTEVIAHLIDSLYQGDLLKAVQSAVTRLRGAFAIAVICRDEPQRMVGARQGSPLVVGIGENEHFLASDALALAGTTDRIVYLEEGDTVDISLNDCHIYDAQGRPAPREVRVVSVYAGVSELGPYRHFMQKEIFEQPRAISDTLQGLAGISPELFGDGALPILQQTDSILILACGTSYYAGLTAKYWMESIARIPVEVEIASEYRYRDSVPSPNRLVVTISQSGETADTLAALRHARDLGMNRSLTICNVATSAMVRECALSYITRAGVEIGVASTKAFTTQLTALFLLSLVIAKIRGRLTPEQEAAHMKSLRHLPVAVSAVLALEPQIIAWAEDFSRHNDALFLGRGIHYPIALEGALKLKEISYIHAEAYPAGELKHGPLALVTDKMPVVTIAPNDDLLEKLKSNMQEVRARGGQLYVFADSDTRIMSQEGIHVIRMPENYGQLSPILHVIPLQLLAYHTALVRGTDVDKPRNLAKSVTVE
ncbi:glutamine--fructose-6-phosphate transaminase (isomerizing) [Oxalobacter sp. OxGP1]|uniref:glutamine--fructose-6-phosphate transaminase (isomerizing) n=1 Tax=Oxalobacter paeniformigenes TaxID=2946594 RepID=UPI0022B002E3|nr:glutamine--fructose-6-phosphate transaminase (isomerizing) [Oxalobacter paeniformigenes]MCZ4053642.1 glutamine--fructose-6-phosphate transaminase (isomerizing) [Oxalobacter paeniformigenes]